MKTSPEVRPGNADWQKFDFLFNSCIFLIVLSAISYSLWLTNKGIDFSDEGFYLASISDPRAYIASSSQFGYFYNPIFRLLGGNVAWLRAFNIISTYILSFLFVALLFHCFFDLRAYGRKSVCAMTASLSASSLLIVSFHGKWISSPSYNSMALGSLLIIASGVVLCLREARRFSLAGWLAISAGGSLLFLAKFSSAVILAPIILFLLLVTRKTGPYGIAVMLSTALALIGMAAVWIDGSIFNFADRIALSLKLASLQNSGYSPTETLSRLVSFPKSSYLKIVISGAVFLLFLAWVRDLKKHPVFFSLLFGVMLILAIFLEISLLGKDYKGAYVQAMLLVSLFFGAVLLAASNRYQLVSEIGRNRLLLAVFLLLLPHIYAFGTNNDYFFQASSAGIFWVVSGLLFISPLLKDRVIGRMFLFPYIVATGAYSLFLLVMAAEHPYRQALALRAATSPIQIGTSQSVLFFNPFQNVFLKKMKSALQTAMLPPGQAVIDLTGTSPGTLFSIGAKGLGLAWFVGGYPGSKSVMEEALRHVPCTQLANAWILEDLEGRTKIDASVLSGFGVNLEADYALVAKWKVPFGARDRDQTVEKLYKPVGSVETAIKNCEDLRLSHQSRTAVFGP